MAQRVERARLSIAAGNVIQGAMLASGIAALALSTSDATSGLRAIGLVVGYALVYFSVHAPAHWLVDRLVGIRFTHYSIGGTTHPAAYPPGMRWLFEHLPFFAAHVERASLRVASPIGRAMMFGAGITSSLVLCTLAASWCAIGGAPGGTMLLVAHVLWFAGALVGELRTRGDYARAAEALAADRRGA